MKIDQIIKRGDIINIIDRIKSMDIYELAEFLYHADCDICPCDKYNHKECYKDNCDCIGMIVRWLKSKVE